MSNLELSSPTHLGRTVVLGYCDISAAGIRECKTKYCEAMKQNHTTVRTRIHYVSRVSVGFQKLN